MLQIRIASEPHPAKVDDELGRTELGAYPGISPAEAWERGRAAWKLKANRVMEHSEVEVIDPSGTVLAVASLRGIYRHGNRYELLGDVLPDDPRVGQPSPHPHRSRNSINYY